MYNCKHSNYNLNVLGWHFILLLLQDQDYLDDQEDLEVLEDIEDLHTRLYYRPTIVTYYCDILVLVPCFRQQWTQEVDSLHSIEYYHLSITTLLIPPVVQLQI